MRFGKIIVGVMLLTLLGAGTVAAHGGGHRGRHHGYHTPAPLGFTAHVSSSHPGGWLRIFVRASGGSEQERSSWTGNSAAFFVDGLASSAIRRFGEGYRFGKAWLRVPSSQPPGTVLVGVTLTWTGGSQTIESYATIRLDEDDD